MNNKQKYKEFAEKEGLPIFMQPFWLDSVCENGMEWDVILYEKGGEIWGSFVYVIQKKYAFTLIILPKLTQFLGPYIKYTEGQKYYTKLSWEKEVMNYFIDNLPNFDYFNMNFHYSITNWLPFYWRGFKQTTRYTYVIDKNLKIEQLSQDFETDIRRRRRKAEKLGVEVIETKEIEDLYRLNSLTFNRKGIKIPYSLDFVKRIYYSLEKENAVKILMAKYQHEYIASAFLVEDKNNVYYLMGGIEPSKKDLGAMDLILYESIKYTLSKNKNFDFEGSMVESIEKYFRSFGAIQKPYFNVYKINSKLLKIRQCLMDILK